MRTPKKTTVMAVKPSREQELRAGIEQKLSRYFGTTPAEANKDQVYKAVLLGVRAGGISVDDYSFQRGSKKDALGRSSHEE